MKILLTEDVVKRRIQELGEELTRIYRGKPLSCVILMKGGFVFAADLLRRMDMELCVEMIRASSYLGQHSTGNVELSGTFSVPLRGRHLLLIDDVLDSGITLKKLYDELQKESPLDIRSCVLVEKDIPRSPEAVQHADFAAFHTGNGFLAGFGMDLDERFRNLPYIADLDKED